jgi:hypothetical protein
MKHGPVQVAIVAPADAPKDPALQLVQDPAVPREYLPAGQMAGFTEPVGHAYPAGHGPSHVVSVWALFTPKYPAPHPVQAPAPTADHFPAGHTAAVGDVEPTTQKYPAAHWAVQVFAVWASTSP